MAICAYCEKNRKPSREHLIPNWYLKIDPSPDDVGFLERIKEKFTQSESVIKDVCEECNNIHLGRLDAYGKEVYDGFLKKYVFAGEEVNFSIEYLTFVKWLVKLSFNSARIHKTDLDILGDYAKLLISNEALPPQIILFASTVAPSVFDQEGLPSQASISDGNPLLPSWFRIGVFRIKEFDSIEWAFRHVTINSYCFYICIPKIGSEKAVAERARVIEKMMASESFGVKIEPDGSAKLRPPFVDAAIYSTAHMQAFPIAYDLIEDPVARELVRGDHGLLLYAIDRDDIENKNTAPLLDFLNYLASAREIALGTMEKIEFSVHGYDNDPRELWVIPEVREFLKVVDEKWPYWMMFQHPDGKWMRVLTACLLPVENKNQPDREFFSALINRWFVGLNEISHKCAITVEINKRQSFSAMHVITGVRHSEDKSR